MRSHFEACIGSDILDGNLAKLNRFFRRSLGIGAPLAECTHEESK
jgi:hypothetical protein